MDLAQVAAVLVTRGNVDMAPVLASLPFAEVVVWDNSERLDLRVYGRYAALAEIGAEYVYTQDDDAICPAAAITEAYTGNGLLVNVPPGEYPWLAWGACFPKRDPDAAFVRYLEHHPYDRFFQRWADVCYAHTAGWDTIDLGHKDLPWATAPDRMYHEPGHYTEQALMRRRVAELARG